jgi:hypothetical protein
MSSLIQCYINLYPFNPINNKKKEIYRLRPRARATNQEYTFRFAPVNSHFPLPLSLHVPLFALPQPGLGLRPHFILNPLHSYSYSGCALPPRVRSAFFYSPCRAQTTRCAQTVKKIQADLPTPSRAAGGGCGRLSSLAFGGY